MHELTIAQSIIEIAEEIAFNEKADSVQSIEIEIGALSGVVLEALEFALEVSTKNTMLENAKVDYTNINGKAECLNCNYSFETNDLLTFCPKCKAASFKIIDGKQLRIKSLIL